MATDLVLEQRMVPSLRAPIVVSERAESTRHRLLVPMSWGCTPHWTSSSKRLINARCETVDTLPSFRAAYADRRCIVPASAFFEWQHDGRHRVRHRFSCADEPVMAMAGLWWPASETEQRAGLWGSYVIVTTAPNEVVAPIHDRMPVVLCDETAVAAWLEGTPGDARQVMRPCAATRLVAERMEEDLPAGRSHGADSAPTLF